MGRSGHCHVEDSGAAGRLGDDCVGVDDDGGVVLETLRRHRVGDLQASVGAGAQRGEDGGVVRRRDHRDRALDLLQEPFDGRLQVTDPMSTKGLEYDATVVVDPDAIVAESPGGARVLYVAMTRAAHRMTVLR